MVASSLPYDHGALAENLEADESIPEGAAAEGRPIAGGRSAVSGGRGHARERPGDHRPRVDHHLPRHVIPEEPAIEVEVVARENDAIIELPLFGSIWPSVLAFRYLVLC